MNIKQPAAGPRRLFTAVAVVMIWLPHLEPALAQELGEQPTVAEPIKVMSFNIRYGSAKDGDDHWQHRSYLVAETIRMFDPDLLGLQEVLQFQAEFLQQALPDHGFHGVGRDDGKAAGEYVPVMYRKSRFRLLASGHFWLSETPDIAGSKSWDSSLPRMVSWVRLSDLQNDGAQLVFVNTHFDHRGPTARLESARLMRARTDEFLTAGTPVVITGDFNTTEDGRPYAELIAADHQDMPPLLDSFRQAQRERSPDESSISRWNGQRRGSRIDWILHSQQFTTLQSVINLTHESGRYPSDHYPVQAILRLQ